MIALKGHSLTSLSQIQSQISYQAGSILPQRYIIYPKTWRSADGDLSEKWSCSGSAEMALFQSKALECKALSWKVKAHLFGSSQQFLSILPPAIFSHSSTGSLITEKLKRERRVLLPAPRFPQIEITPDINVIKPLNCQSNLYPFKFQKTFPNKINNTQTHSPSPLLYPKIWALLVDSLTVKISDQFFRVKEVGI